MLKFCGIQGFVLGGKVDGLPTGIYIVESTTPPGHVLMKEEDKNVDFGEPFVPGPELLPPISVGDLHLVPAELTLFPGVGAPFAGQMRPLADRKQILYLVVLTNFFQTGSK